MIQLANHPLAVELDALVQSWEDEGVPLQEILALLHEYLEIWEDVASY